MKTLQQLMVEEEKILKKLETKREQIKKQKNAAKKEKANRLWKLMSPYISEKQMLESSDEDVIAIIKAHLNGEKHPSDAQDKEDKKETVAAQKESKDEEQTDEV